MPIRAQIVTWVIAALAALALRAFPIDMATAAKTSDGIIHVKSGYGVATLPQACVMRELESGELVALDVEPALAPVSIIASVRNRSDSPQRSKLPHASMRCSMSGIVPPFAPQSPPIMRRS